ncbi:hypothetical protein DFS34DRAFT_598490 [Phlyctochytrium arcticum]|nr:hypothetical protein DFS34DRAFT_598490 [Phlyctochytrium arcticum]
MDPHSTIAEPDELVTEPNTEPESQPDVDVAKVDVEIATKPRASRTPKQIEAQRRATKKRAKNLRKMAEQRKVQEEKLKLEEAKALLKRSREEKRKLREEKQLASLAKKPKPMPKEKPKPERAKTFEAEKVQPLYESDASTDGGLESDNAEPKTYTVQFKDIYGY